MAEPLCTDQPQTLRLLILAADEYPPFRVDTAVLFEQEMVSRGHAIDWIMQSAAPRERAFSIRRSRNGVVYLANTDTRNSWYGRFRKNLLSFVNDLLIFKRLTRRRYHFIQVKDKFLAAIIGLLAARIRGSLFVFWLSYPFPEASIYEARTGTARYPLLYFIRGHLFAFVLYKIVGRLADHVFVQSEQMKRDVCERGIPEVRVSAVPMGVADSLLCAMTNTQRTDHPAIVYLGTLLKTRRLDFLVRALAGVVEERPDAVLYFVGPEELPGDRAVLENEAARLGLLSNVVFTGRLDRSEALRYVRMADVCVSPFFPTPILNSTSPTKLIEYMALSKAVVANDHPEQSEVIGKSGGGLCVPYEEIQFAEAILYILDHPEEARRMGARGHEFVVGHRTYSSIADGVEQQYRRILEAGREKLGASNA